MKLKDDFPLTEQLIYFDNSVMGLMPESTLKVIEGYTESLVHHMRGREKYRIYMGGFPGYENARTRAKEAFSKVIGAETGEVACVPNATTGVNTIFNMIPIESGDNIVATDLLYPMGAAAVHNQERRGAESRFIKGYGGLVETSAFEKVVDDDTKILYVDHAGWFNGILFDLPALSEIAHDHGAYLVVDATQSFGALDWQIDERGLAITGTCPTDESPSAQVAILGESGPLWTGPWHRVVHLEYFVRALIPPEMQDAPAVARRLQHRLPRPAPTLDRPAETR